MIGTVFDIVLVAVALLVAAIAVLALRRWLLQRGGGTFDCSVRLTHARVGRGWVLGLARYTDETLQWFRVFSFAPRPRRVFTRRDLVVRSRRSPVPTEALMLYTDHIVVECSLGSSGQTVELAMAEDALTGFLAWLEAAPPGSDSKGGEAGYF